MIVDCYTHTWESADELGHCAPVNGRHGVPNPPPIDPGAPGAARHLAATEPVSATIVLGFKSRYLGANISNQKVAAYVRQHPDRLIGFAGIDPANPKAAIEDIHYARTELGLRGITVAPAAQDFHPHNSQAMLVYAQAQRHGLPILFHTGIHLTAATKLEYARPIHLDEVARELPDLKIVIAHLGYPWIQETLVLLAKHPNVYAEISWLLHQPWQAYQALLGAHQYGVMDKLLFGSGFPYFSPAQCLDELYHINHLCHGTNLPAIPREQLRGIVERDALGLLGIDLPQKRETPPPVAPESPDDANEDA